MGLVDDETGEILKVKRSAVDIANDRLRQIEASHAKLKELDPDIYRVLEAHREEFGPLHLKFVRPLESENGRSVEQGIDGICTGAGPGTGGAQ